MAETQNNETADVSSKIKKNIMTLQFDLDALHKPSIPIIPDNEKVWTTKAEMSQEYLNLAAILNILALYVAKACNDGPEVRENSMKRLITLKTFLTTLLENLDINGYMTYGLLTELLHDTYMKISGNQQTVRLLKRMQNRVENLSNEKTKTYTS